MKIISATINKGDTRNENEYIACIEMEDEGRRVTARYTDFRPDEALAQAVRCACAEFTNRVVNSIQTEIAVKF